MPVLRNPVAALRQRRLLRDLEPQVGRVETYLAAEKQRLGRAERAPIVFFNASTRIHTLSLNAAFSMLASWAVRAGGDEVLHLVCDSGMRPCVLGTDRRSPEAVPPCRPCLDLSRTLFSEPRTLPVRSVPQPALRRELARLPLDQLTAWESDGLPFGSLVLPSMRWILRRHHLPESDEVRSLFAGYLASAVALAEEVRNHLTACKPGALVVFNGIFYPEAVARRVAQDLAIPVVTHEVGLRPFSAFFSHAEATFREVEVPQGEGLTPDQEAELEAILARRFQGEFTMAGVRFWPQMKELPRPLADKRRGFRQMATVFTNVVFDTSQVHANVLFEDMFEWLDLLAQVIRAEANTLFVVRAHPDETRRGKESQESVADWFRRSRLDQAGNAVFIGPDDPVSSYELIRESKFVLVYNSSVGLEATILGRPALCAGRARFTQTEAAYAPLRRSEYWETLKEFLAAGAPAVPEPRVRNARAFLYHEYFAASLDLGEFLIPDPRLAGMVRFSSFPPSRLIEADVFRVLRAGIVDRRAFVESGRRPAGPAGKLTGDPSLGRGVSRSRGEA